MASLIRVLDSIKNKFVYSVIVYLYAELKFLNLYLLSKKYAIPIFKGFPSGSSFYFMGSGSSVNALSSGDLKELENKMTIGPNCWLFHDFVPNYYTLEGEKGVIPDNYLKEFKRALLNKSRLDSVVKVLVHVSAVRSLPALRDLNNEQIKFYLYDHLKPVTLKTSNLDMVWQLMEKIVSRKRYRGISIGKGATLERICTFIKIAGFEELGLIGVDLYDRKTFYQNNAALVEQLCIGDLSKSHKTNDPKYKTFTVTETLAAIFQNKSTRCKVFIVNKSSQLNKLFKWRNV
ncbi:hypothetical protein N9Y03_02545 [Luminiphilus sp.]|nr:hypothetical protein [Luminiphilus sp.]